MSTSRSGVRGEPYGEPVQAWNRLCSGSCTPPPVKAVEIPKKGGRGVRVLGVPTVADRVVVYLYPEPEVEPVFHPHPTGTGRDGQLMTRSGAAGSGVGDTTGFSIWISSRSSLADHALVWKAVAHHTDR